MEKEKMFLTINDLKPGMVVAQEIRSDNSKILLSAGSIITEGIITILKEKYLENKISIYSEVDSDDPLELEKIKITEDLEKRFSNFSYNIENIFDDMELSRKTNMNEVRSFAKKVHDELNSPSAVIRNIVLYGSGSDSIYRHSVNVAALSYILGGWIGFDEIQVNLLTYSAILHDFGKTKIDKNILNKPASLTSKEMEVIKSHPIIGYNYVKDIPYLDKSVGYGVVMHHERLDGSGYPLGISGDKIHNFARIIAIADTFDAINSNRVYKSKKSPFIALETIKKESLGKLDYEYSKIFIDHVANYYIGENALLDTGDVCKIIHIDSNDLARPMLLNKDEFIDLKQRKDLHVKELVL